MSEQNELSAAIERLRKYASPAGDSDAFVDADILTVCAAAEQLTAEIRAKESACNQAVSFGERNAELEAERDALADMLNPLLSSDGLAKIELRLQKSIARVKSMHAAVEAAKAYYADEYHTTRTAFAAALSDFQQSENP